MAYVVTISASFGAHGDKIGRAVAERLSLPFLDRAIPASALYAKTGPSGLAESRDEPVPSRWARLFMRFANVDAPMGPSNMSLEQIKTLERFRSENEVKLHEMADSTGAVILGRAGMVVLGGRPNVLCVRLSGPVEGRISQVVAQGVDEASARKAQVEVDRARDAYARVLFNARQNDCRLYHLVLDTTVLSVDTCVDVIVRAASDGFVRFLTAQ
jgi:cytidylate kinase